MESVDNVDKKEKVIMVNEEKECRITEKSKKTEKVDKSCYVN